jgi:hypothetical protein
MLIPGLTHEAPETHRLGGVGPDAREVAWKGHLPVGQTPLVLSRRHTAVAFADRLVFSMLKALGICAPAHMGVSPRIDASLPMLWPLYGGTGPHNPGDEVATRNVLHGTQ